MPLAARRIRTIGRVDAEAIARRLWPGARPLVEVLGGGITNRNFKISVGDETFVLRIGGKDTTLLGIDRSHEYEASSVAAGLGVGPQVVRFVEREGYLVTRFVGGETVPVDELRRPARLHEFAQTLRRVHEGPPIAARFDSFRVVENYAATALTHAVAVPPEYEVAKQVADRIERVRGRPPLCTCHNDLLNANLIATGDGLVIVDWEYAGMGDRFFDLANFSANHELTADENRGLLRSYFGELRPEDEDALGLMRFMSDFREAMWGVVQQGISELEVDFVGYANQHFERLARTAADPDFQAALAR
jgi:thiamine kinase-like enzyme